MDEWKVVPLKRSVGKLQSSTPEQMADGKLSVTPEQMKDGKLIENICGKKYLCKNSESKQLTATVDVTSDRKGDKVDKVETPKKLRRNGRKKKWKIGPPKPSVLDNSFRSKISDIVEIFRNEMAIDTRKNSTKSIFQVI